MAKDIPGDDIFSMKNSQLISSRLDGEVYFDSSKFNSITIPKRFDKKVLNLSREKYTKEIRNEINPISDMVEEFGYGGNIYSALYEGLLNAHQHGNSNSNKKKIIFASSITPQNLEFIIADEGIKLHSRFTRFILALREKDLANDGFINWYNFSHEKKSPINNGTGTSFMHVYMDEVKYFKSEELGGLAVYMKKNK